MPNEYIVIDKGLNNCWRDARIVIDMDEGENKTFDSMLEAEAELAKYKNGMIVGAEDLPDYTPDLLDEVVAYITKMKELVHLLPYDQEQFFRANLRAPHIILNKIERWKLTVKL